MSVMAYMFLDRLGVRMARGPPTLSFDAMGGGATTSRPGLSKRLFRNTARSAVSACVRMKVPRLRECTRGPSARAWATASLRWRRASCMGGGMGHEGRQGGRQGGGGRGGMGHGGSCMGAGGAWGTGPPAWTGGDGQWGMGLGVGEGKGASCMGRGRGHRGSGAGGTRPNQHPIPIRPLTDSIESPLSTGRCCC